MAEHTSPRRIGLVGDAHGNVGFGVKAINTLIERGVREIHFLGDFGFVWLGKQTQNLALKSLELALTRGSAVAVVTGGNHEGYTEWQKIQPDKNGYRWVRKHIALLPRGWRSTTESGRVIASLGGANSIDRYSRKPADIGGTWWREEQITESDLDALGNEPVDVLLGHDSPITEALTRKLIPTQHLWNPQGLAYSDRGQAMFDRGVRQVAPELVVGGHYHLFLDTNQQFKKPNGEPFESRVVILNAEFHYPSVAILDTDDLSLEFIEVRQ